ncbi:phenylacetate-CoA oxygenase subunit PaaC [Paenibacillus sp. N1-5-1-14]|uniref:1,2-phenylacetyl-CoA epoxidase subunit PaaC n=1 Tax=Paenibacillus radicibacter TaxID=2972488 RepID=UPI002158FBDF|nr:1,2-phenylacetyl-CoA epoxidase subunit PaaC [Paenibacillus radicibacter]MCR8641808.1 phenylacetate-CoA oxygenase subunit PaaC [Paenibacillus radicibacter]
MDTNNQIRKIESVNEATGQPEYTAALKELLFQLADDDFILAYRGSEWLGLAPHIEEDVAFSSMSQDMMGHAVMLYTLLEELGAGSSDDLAQLRSPEQFRNCILAERVNGTGGYMEQPHYDWMYAIVRFYMYGMYKQIRLDALLDSSFTPLAHLARKMITEHRYHMMHWQTWMKQLATSNEEATARMTQAVQSVWEDLDGLLSLGAHGDAFNKHGLIEAEEVMRERFNEKTQAAFAAFHIAWLGDPQVSQVNGRLGQHTEELASALTNISAVYKLDPTANW